MSTPETPLYGGATPSTAQTNVQAPQTKDLLTPTSDRARANAASLFDGAVETYSKIQDFKSSQNQERKLREYRSEGEDEIMRRLQMAPGTDNGSANNPDGTINTKVIDDIIYETQKKINELNPSFINPISDVEAQNQRANISSDIQTRAYALAARHNIQSARQAYSDNLELAQTVGDFAGMRDTIQQGIQAGYETQASAATKIFKINKAESLQRYASMPPDQVYDLLESGALNDELSATEQEDLRKKLTTGLRENQRDGFAESFTLTPKNKNNGDKDSPEFTGLFSKKECDWINAIRSGNSSEVMPDIETAAIEEVSSLNFLSPGSDNMEKKKAEYIRRYEQLGLKKEFLNSQWSRFEKLSEEKKIPSIQITGILDRLSDRGELQNPQATKFFTDKLANYPSFKAERVARIKKPGSSIEVSDKLLLQEEAKSHSALLRSQISEQFLTWRTQEGEDASPIVQEQQLIAITKRLTDNPNLNYAPAAEPIDDIVLSAASKARQAQANKYRSWLEKRGATTYINTQPETTPAKPTLISYDTTQKDLPEGILLPQHMMDGIDPSTATVDITFDNKKYRRFRILGATENDTPLMTYAVAKSGMYRTNKAYNVNMKITNGDQEAPMQYQPPANGAKPQNKGIHTTVIQQPTTSVDTLRRHTPAPLTPYLDDFITIGEKHGVDPALLLSIAKLETGNGTSKAFLKKNNAMGISPNGGGPRAFNSVAEGIDYMARQIKRNYIDKGRTTLASIGAKYAPSGASNDPHNTNSTWAQHVANNYTTIKTNH